MFFVLRYSFTSSMYLNSEQSSGLGISGEVTNFSKITAE